MPAVKVFLFGLEVICYRVYGVDLCGLRGCLRLFEVEPLDQLWPLGHLKPDEAKRDKLRSPKAKQGQLRSVEVNRGQSRPVEVIMLQTFEFMWAFCEGNHGQPIEAKRVNLRSIEANRGQTTRKKNHKKIRYFFW